MCDKVRQKYETAPLIDWNILPRMSLSSSLPALISQVLHHILHSFDLRVVNLMWNFHWPAASSRIICRPLLTYFHSEFFVYFQRRFILLRSCHWFVEGFGARSICAEFIQSEGSQLQYSQGNVVAGSDRYFGHVGRYFGHQCWNARR